MLNLEEERQKFIENILSTIAACKLKLSRESGYDVGVPHTVDRMLQVLCYSGMEGDEEYLSGRLFLDIV